MSRKCPKWGWRGRAAERERGEVGVHDGLGAPQVSPRAARSRLVYLSACLADSKRKQFTVSARSRAAPVTVPPGYVPPPPRGEPNPIYFVPLERGQTVAIQWGGGENPIRTPQTSPGRWGGGGSWATRVPRPAGLPSGERRARLRLRPAGAGVTWPARPASISRAEASLTRARGGGGDGGELGRAEGRLPAADRREGDAGARAGAAAGLTWR